MSNVPIAVKGVVHGKTIELEHDSGLPDGQEVSVIVRPAGQIPQALLDSFGAWSDDPEGLDEYIKQVYRDRESDPRNEPLP
jgi:hypothetical protein